MQSTKEAEGEDKEEIARQYAEKMMQRDWGGWDRNDSILIGIFYKRYIEKLKELLTTPSSKEAGKENEQPVAFIYDDEQKILYNRDTKYSYIKYPCIFLSKEDDGKKMVLGKDFELKDMLGPGDKDIYGKQATQIIVVPISQPVKESGNEAIEFAKWILKEFNNGNIGIGSKWDWNGKFISESGLYNLFKQTKP